MTAMITNSEISHVSSNEQEYISETAQNLSLAILHRIVYHQGVPLMSAARGKRSSQYTSSSPTAVRAHNTTQEPVKTKPRGPNLRIIVPSSGPTPAPGSTAADTSTKQPRCPLALPTFTITPPTPMTPLSPIHPPSPTDPPYTPRSYQDLACRAPPRARVPYLPRYCPHSLHALVSARASGCPLCTVQLLACDTWWSSSSSAASTTLQAPRVLPAECTSTMRAVYYALGAPLGELDRSCVDWDVIKSIVFIPRAYRIGINISKKSAVRESSRIRGLFRRARRVFSSPSREPMTPSISIAHGRFETRP